MIVGDKRTSDVTVRAVAESAYARVKSRVSEYLEVKYARRLARKGAGLFSPADFGYFNPANDSRVRAANVICLYWINGGFVRPEGLAGLSQPLVWRLSDIWPLSGGCHYPGGCERFVEHCGECPQLEKQDTEDRSRQLWERKARVWRHLDLTIVAPSRWMAGLVARSSLFRDRRIEVIPTGVDLVRYQLQDRQHTRELLGLPQDRKLILFISNDILGDIRKGYRDFFTALRKIAENDADQYHVVLVGEINKSALSEFPMAVTALGRLSDETRLNIAYASSDVVVCPSQEDNLPNTVLEAMASGIPVVGYEVGGMNDVIDHCANGFLAQPGDISGLVEGIRWVLADSQRWTALAQSARRKAETAFSADMQTERYISLYQELAARRVSRGIAVESV